MAKKKLNAQQIKSRVEELQEKAKQGLLDSGTVWQGCGDGLYVTVNNNTAKTDWRARVKGAPSDECYLGEYGENRTTYKTARAQVKELQAKYVIAKREAKKTGSQTLEEFFTKIYLPKEIARRKNSSNRPQRYKHLVNDYLKPLKLKQLTAISKKDLIEVLDASEATESTKCDICALMNGIYDHAINRELVDVNPFKGMNKGKEAVYRRPQKEHHKSVETASYKSAVLDHLTEFEPFYQAIFLLIIMSGLRRGEVVNLRWSWIDTKTKMIVIPPDAAGANKHGRGDGTGKPTIKPLTPHVIELLQFMKKCAVVSSEYVCQSPFMDKPQPILSQSVGRIWHRSIKDCTIHGNRAVLRSWLLEQCRMIEGIKVHLFSKEIADFAITHDERTETDKPYDVRNFWDDEVRTALKVWENYVYDNLPKKLLKIFKIGSKNPIEGLN